MYYLTTSSKLDFDKPIVTRLTAIDKGLVTCTVKNKLCIPHNHYGVLYGTVGVPITLLLE